MNTFHPDAPGLARTRATSLAMEQAVTTASTILSIVSDQIMMRWGRDVAVEPEDSFEALGLDELDRREIVMRVEAECQLTREIRECEILTVSHLISAVERIADKEKCDG